MFLELLALSAASEALDTSDEAKRAVALSGREKGFNIMIPLTNVKISSGWNKYTVEYQKPSLISLNMIRSIHRSDCDRYTIVNYIGGNGCNCKETPLEIDSIIKNQIKELSLLIKRV